MAQLKFGQILEASPAYQRAVAAQRAKELAKANEQTLPMKPILHAANGNWNVIHIPAEITEVLAQAERERLTDWFLKAEYNEPHPAAAVIIEYHAKKHGLTVDDLKSTSRVAHIVSAKVDAIVDIYRRRPDFSLPQIGKEMGGRDHTTILHALRRRGIHLKARRSPFDPAEARRLYQSGFSIEEIADRLSYSVDVVRKATAEVRSRSSQYQRVHARIMAFINLPMSEIIKRTGYRRETIESHMRVEKEMRA